MEFKVDPNLAKFLHNGVDEGIKRGVRRSIKETMNYVVSNSVKSLKAARFLSSAVTNKALKSGVETELGDSHCVISFSVKRQSLWRVPYKTFIVSHPKWKGMKLTKIQVNIGGKGFKDDPLKPFWVKGKGQPVRKPNPKDKPLALYRVGAGRKPLKKATAPSLAKMVEDSGLGNTLQKKGEEYLLERMKRNVEYFIDQINT